MIQTKPPGKKHQMKDKEMDVAGKKHETASSIFTHGQHEVSDGKV